MFEWDELNFSFVLSSLSFCKKKSTNKNQPKKKAIVKMDNHNGYANFHHNKISDDYDGDQQRQNRHQNHQDHKQQHRSRMNDDDGNDGELKMIVDGGECQNRCNQSTEFKNIRFDDDDDKGRNNNPIVGADSTDDIQKDLLLVFNYGNNKTIVGESGRDNDLNVQKLSSSQPQQNQQSLFFVTEKNSIQRPPKFSAIDDDDDNESSIREHLLPRLNIVKKQLKDFENVDPFGTSKLKLNNPNDKHQDDDDAMNHEHYPISDGSNDFNNETNEILGPDRIVRNDFHSNQSSPTTFLNNSTKEEEKVDAHNLVRNDPETIITFVADKNDDDYLHHQRDRWNLEQNLRPLSRLATLFDNRSRWSPKNVAPETLDRILLIEKDHNLITNSNPVASSTTISAASLSSPLNQDSLLRIFRGNHRQPKSSYGSLIGDNQSKLIDLIQPQQRKRLVLPLFNQNQQYRSRSNLWQSIASIPIYFYPSDLIVPMKNKFSSMGSSRIFDRTLLQRNHSIVKQSQPQSMHQSKLKDLIPNKSSEPAKSQIIFYSYRDPMNSKILDKSSKRSQQKQRPSSNIFGANPIDYPSHQTSGTNVYDFENDDVDAGDDDGGGGSKKSPKTTTQVFTIRSEEFLKKSKSLTNNQSSNEYIMASQNHHNHQQSNKQQNPHLFSTIHEKRIKHQSLVTATKADSKKHNDGNNGKNNQFRTNLDGHELQRSFRFDANKFAASSSNNDENEKDHRSKSERPLIDTNLFSNYKTLNDMDRFRSRQYSLSQPASPSKSLSSLFLSSGSSSMKTGNDIVSLSSSSSTPSPSSSVSEQPTTPTSLNQEHFDPIKIKKSINFIWPTNSIAVENRTNHFQQQQQQQQQHQCDPKLNCKLPKCFCPGIKSPR